jgi:hypothetical protein
LNSAGNITTSTAIAKSRRTYRLLFLFIYFYSHFRAQNQEIGTRLNNGELKMNFPGIYFKHNSAEYAQMPYSVDSCFIYIAKHFEDLKSYVLWRDSLETEHLTSKRIHKLQQSMKTYTAIGSVHIQSMGKAQKLSRRTLNLAANSKQSQFLLSLNSVFEVSGTLPPASSKRKKFCWFCFFHLKSCQVNRYFFSKLRGK